MALDDSAAYYVIFNLLGGMQFLMLQCYNIFYEVQHTER